MIAGKNRVIRGAVDELYEISASAEVREQYESRLKAYRDKLAAEHIAFDKGIKKGIKETTVNVARNALKEGFSHELVAKITGLSVEEIRGMR